ncbi:MAG: hypothetical protein IPK83_02855 [Planctomycetes bacterium]|nr:hypothetical protein [Planctomycetota bacterium]
MYFGACDSGAPSLPGSVDSAKSSRASDRSLVRAARRAYDGAPPIIPHMQMGASCTSCHSQTGIQFGDMGFAPPMPHTTKSNAGMFARCEQCHVYAEEKALFVESDFLPMRQDLRKGKRATSISPPTMPHQVFMRENCAACHTGPAAREEILCPHPERVRCAQCHVPVTESGEFTRTEPTS